MFVTLLGLGRVSMRFLTVVLNQKSEESDPLLVPYPKQNWHIKPTRNESTNL